VYCRSAIVSDHGVPQLVTLAETLEAHFEVHHIATHTATHAATHIAAHIAAHITTHTATPSIVGDNRVWQLVTLAETLEAHSEVQHT